MATIVEFKRHRLRTTVKVEDYPSLGYDILICSSNANRAVNFSRELWRPGDYEAINGRLGSGGAEKGRVLWATQYHMLPNRWEAMGALLLHVPTRRSKPILIKRVCLQAGLTDRNKIVLTTWLIRCAKKVAAVSEKASGRLHWEVDPQDAGQLCEQYGFTRRGNNRQLAVLEHRDE